MAMDGESALSFSELLARAASGDEEARTELYARYREDVQARVRARTPRVLRRRYDVHDISQSVFAEVLADLPRFEDRGERAFRAWLYTKVEGKVRGKLAKILRPAVGGRREITAGSGVLSWPMDSAPGPVTEVDRRDRAARMEELLETLDPEQREVVRLRTREQLAFGDIAERLGLASADAARMRFARAIEKLRGVWPE